MSDNDFPDLHSKLRNSSVKIIVEGIVGDGNKRMEISIDNVPRKRNSDRMKSLMICENKSAFGRVHTSVHMRRNNVKKIFCQSMTDCLSY